MTTHFNSRLLHFRQTKHCHQILKIFITWLLVNTYPYMDIPYLDTHSSKNSLLINSITFFIGLGDGGVQISSEVLNVGSSDMLGELPQSGD